MEIDTLDLTSNPEEITRAEFDCIWIAFGPRAATDPIRPPSLQWVDWKLRGQISRYLLGLSSPPAVTTFLPTMKRLGTPYVALDGAESLDWQSFRKNCEGLKLRKVLLLCENASHREDAKKKLAALPASGYPRSVVLGLEEPRAEREPSERG